MDGTIDSYGREGTINSILRSWIILKEFQGPTNKKKKTYIIIFLTNLKIKKPFLIICFRGGGWQGAMALTNPP